MARKEYTNVLTIAGSDGSGGAGVQADLKTFAAFGCYGLSAITSITSQSTKGVRASYPLPPRQVREQLLVLLDDISVDTVKIGMLCNEEIIDTVAEVLTSYPVKHIVLDPIIISSSGKELLNKEGIEALKAKMIPITSILTPNLPEAQMLVGQYFTESTFPQMGDELLDLGAGAVLIKGGHAIGEECTDFLFEKNKEPKAFTANRIITKNTHGTGCTLSSAIAAFLAKGFSLSEAIESAKAYLSEALIHGAAYRLGSGSGPLHHFHQFW